MGDLLEDRIIADHERKLNEAYWKERNAMTCRFELEFKGAAYPRSCPTCQFGPCKRGYTQIKNDGKPGYSIQAPNGQINFYSSEMKLIGANGPNGETGGTFPPPPPPEPPGKAFPVPNSGPLPLHKRLKLMVYLQERFKLSSEAELFDIVGDIERLARD